MSAPTVKTFNDAEINRLTKESDPTLREYIEALKRALQGSNDLLNVAKKKIFKYAEKYGDVE